MRTNYITGVALALLTTFSINVNAMIIEGSFTATVKTSQEYTKGSDWTYNALVGDIINGTIWINTDLAPADANSNTTIGHYESTANDWINISVSLNSVITDFEGTTNQRVQTYDESFGHSYDQWGTLVDDTYINTVSTYTYSLTKLIEFTVFDTPGLTPGLMLETDGLDELFSWDDTDGSSGQGNFTVHSSTKDYGNTIEEDLLTLSFDMNSLELHEASPVPVPAAAWLLSSGLICLIGFARRKARA